MKTQITLGCSLIHPIILSLGDFKKRSVCNFNRLNS